MTTDMKERIKTELEQVRVDGKDRAGRIGDILKAAAAMTFEEVKEGSAELHVFTRKSLAEVLEELKQTADEQAHDEAVADVPVEDAEVTVPTWRYLIRQAIEVVRDRRGDWFQSFKNHLNENAAKIDQEMTDEYGDRYLKVKSVFQRIVSQLVTEKSVQDKDADSPVQPVTIEVMDGEDPVLVATPLVDTEASEAENQ